MLMAIENLKPPSFYMVGCNFIKLLFPKIILQQIFLFPKIMPDVISWNFVNILTFQISVDIGSDTANFSSALSRTKLAEMNGTSQIIPIASTSSKQNTLRKPAEQHSTEIGIIFIFDV